MKTESRPFYLCTLFLGIAVGGIVAVSLFSWIGSIYGLPLQNILSTDGLRWSLRHALSAYTASPICGVLTLCFGIGIVVHSGFIHAIRTLIFRRQKRGLPSHHFLSLKQRRALLPTILIFVLYVGLLLLGIYGSQGLLLGVTGTLQHSPFTEGGVVILSFGLGLTGTVYGYFSDKFSRHDGLLQGMCRLISPLAPALVVMFFFCQLFSVADYTGCSSFFVFPPDTLFRTVLEYLTYYLPIVTILFVPSEWK